MGFKVFKNTVLLFVLVMISCASKLKNEKEKVEGIMTDDHRLMTEVEKQTTNDKRLNIVVGANQTELYLPLLKGKRVGVVANQSSVVFKVGRRMTDDRSYTHLVDSLLALGIEVKKVFAPEHGFRGTADAGELIKDGIDTKTGVPIISLYGDNKKPKLEQLKETKKYETDIEKGVSVINVMVFDLQDVGVRFYTYISTLHYVMEACAETNIPLIILDRPNPNGHYIDGPILEKEYSSFVGMHPIPIAHGMTIGEYAQMINGEKWLKNGVQCDLKVIPIKNYNHDLSYSLPIKPSPNLPNDKAINLYPSLCFFEGTNVNAGRGTEKQFQVFGSPFLNPKVYDFNYIPQPNEGAKNPKHLGKLCHGKDLTEAENLGELNLNWLMEAYTNTKNKSEFFNAFFVKLAGTKKLQQQIEAGLNADEIKATWKDGLEAFKSKREKYLIYK